MRRLSLKTRLLLSVSIILVFGFALTNINNYRVSTRSVRKNIVEHALPLTRDNIYSEIQADLMRPVFISSLMANDTFLKDWAIDGEKGVEKITRYLQEIREKYGFFPLFSFRNGPATITISTVFLNGSVWRMPTMSGITISRP